MPESRVEVIEGRRVRVIDRTPPIAPTLELLLSGGRDKTGHLWSPLSIIARKPLRLGGSSKACADDDHRMGSWLEGLYQGSDGVGRSLRLLACADCGAVCVRDVTLDRLPGLPSGRLAPRRRDHVIGWYSGARPGQRRYT